MGVTRYVVDPILDPINFGFSRFLHRLYEVRERYPNAEMMIGVGNLTELIDADSTGINALMVGVMTELDIRYVLTTEVAHWARGSVRELDRARRLMHYARTQGVLPKDIDDSLLTTKDRKVDWRTEEEIRDLHGRITDPNFRIMIDGKHIYCFNRDLFIKDTDIQSIFHQITDQLGPHPASQTWTGDTSIMASLGIDYGTGSWKLALIEGPRVLALKQFEDWSQLEPALKEMGSHHSGLPMVLPSGFGIPITRVQEVDDRDLFEMTLRRGDPTEKGLGQFLQTLRASDFHAYCIPAVKLLPSVPIHRKVNRIDMGTADKLCAVAYLLYNQLALGQSLEAQHFLWGGLQGFDHRPRRPYRRRSRRHGRTYRAEGPRGSRRRIGLSVLFRQGKGVLRRSV
jgi:hypothetical protein